jgi:hypothetical protein
MTEGRFYEQSGIDRYGEGAMAGDLAEEKVSQVLAEQLDRPVASFGPRRVSTARAQQMTWDRRIRHAPDFLGWGRFIEVQGSNGEYVIFKQEKLDDLLWWAGMMPVFFGIYLMSQDKVIFCDIGSVIWSLSQEGTEELVLDADTRYPKQAWKVPVSILFELRVVDAFAAAKVVGK